MAMDTLFPEASRFDIERTKVLLSKKYKKWRHDVMVFEKNPPQTLQQEEVYKTMKHSIRIIEQAVRLILDEETREIISFRYIEGNSRQATIVKYSVITDRTVDRKIVEGLEAIANTLKLWGEL